MLGCSSDTTSYTVLCNLLLRFALPGRWPVYCIGSNKTSPWRVLRFATCLTKWVDSSWFSAIFVFVWARVVGVIVDFSGIIFLAFNLLFVRHSVHLSFVRIFQTVQLYFRSEVCHNLFIRAVLLVGLVNWFHQVWRHLGIYEVFNDCLGTNSEGTFCQFLQFVQTINYFLVRWTEDQMLKLVFWRSHWLGFHVFSTEHSQDFCQILSVPAADVFERLQRITTHERVEVVQIVFFCELIVDF